MMALINSKDNLVAEKKYDYFHKAIKRLDIVA
jgi:hypothetical protein